MLAKDEVSKGEPISLMKIFMFVSKMMPNNDMPS